MDLREFMQRADDLIDQLEPRIDPKQAGLVRDVAHGGDWDEAVDNLIATLRNHQVSISATERAELEALVAFMKWPDSCLAGLSVESPRS